MICPRGDVDPVNLSHIGDERVAGAGRVVGGINGWGSACSTGAPGSKPTVEQQTIICG